jgi:micrococcal nuclease
MKTKISVALAVLLTLACARADEAYYVASSLREPFHRPSCKWAQKIAPGNLQTFKTREEAIKAGHRPCKVCKP